MTVVPSEIMRFGIRLLYAIFGIVVLIQANKALVARWKPETLDGFATLSRWKYLFLELSGYAVTIISIAIASSVFGAEASLWATLIGFGTLGLSLFVNPTMSGIVDGISNRITGLCRVGDEIEFNGEISRVKEIAARATTGLLPDGSNVSYPNSMLAGGRLRNISEENGYRQLITFCVDNNNVSGKIIKRCVTDALNAAGLYHNGHKAACIWKQFGTAGHEFQAVIWMKSAFDAPAMRDKAHDVIEAVAFQNGISLGYTNNNSFSGSSLVVVGGTT